MSDQSMHEKSGFIHSVDCGSMDCANSSVNNNTNENVTTETVDLVDCNANNMANQTLEVETIDLADDNVNNTADRIVEAETIDLVDDCISNNTNQNAMTETVDLVDDYVISNTNQNITFEDYVSNTTIQNTTAEDYISNTTIQNASVETVDLVEDSVSNNTIQNIIAETVDLDKDNESNVISENVVSEQVEGIYDDYQSNVLEIEYDFNKVPYQITGSWKEFNSATRNNFTRGCKWAPDGSCILTCSDDNVLRIFNLPEHLWDASKWQDIAEMEAVVKISEGELIYDYCWYPLMNSSDPATCCLASTSRKSTVHLWDGFTGELRCTYRSFNHLDEIATPHSLSFNADGQKLFCGYEKVVRVFNVDSPGRNFEERQVFAKKSGQPGIISCFAFTSADKAISAAGSYQKTIGIYSEPSGELECLLEGQKGGVTQLQFSPDGTYLYSGGRKDPEILCWDLRNLGTVLFSLRRSCETNQRMYFDVSSCGKYIVSGNQNGVITIWDTTKEPKLISDDVTVMEPIQFFFGHNDCVNGVSFHPSFPLLCSSSGQRKFPVLLDDEDEEIFSPKIDKRDNSLRLWWIGKFN